MPLLHYRALQLDKLAADLLLLVLPTECHHITLERATANPYAGESSRLV
jgi:hypothetical protein